MLEWTKDFETGIPELDAQHRRLFEMIEQISPLIDVSVVDEAAVYKLVDFLETYAREHFDCEERCMIETKCPTREMNVEAHQSFLDGVARFKKDFSDKDEKHEFLTILQASLRAWLRNHILRIDTVLRTVVPRGSPATNGP